MNFKKKYDHYVDTVTIELEKYIDLDIEHVDSLVKGMRYSLLAGGKRLRPVLALAVTEMLGGAESDTLPFACAVEMIHTYSLIHDDLPSMDNDDFRRGKSTNHKVFGEGRAILAGDGLLNYAFEIMASAVLNDDSKIKEKAEAMKYVSNSSGINGMIGGQIIDLDSEGKKIEIDILKRMHSMKTGELIKAPVLSAALVSKATKKEKEHLEIYAKNLGMAFQIKDDILDVEGDSEVLGKPVGSDVANEKSNYITVYGLEESKKILDDVTNKAISSLDIFGEKAKFLITLSEKLVKRVN